MPNKPIVASALALALAAGVSGATAAPDDGQSNGLSKVASTTLSPAARDILLGSALLVGTQPATSQEYQVAAKKFKLFDNGPTFVKSVKAPKKRA